MKNKLLNRYFKFKIKGVNRKDFFFSPKWLKESISSPVESIKNNGSVSTAPNKEAEQHRRKPQGIHTHPWEAGRSERA